MESFGAQSTCLEGAKAPEKSMTTRDTLLLCFRVLANKFDKGNSWENAMIDFSVWEKGVGRTGRGPVQQEWSWELGDHRGANMQAFLWVRHEDMDKLPSNIDAAMRCPVASTYIQFIDSWEKILSFDIHGP